MRVLAYQGLVLEPQLWRKDVRPRTIIGGRIWGSANRREPRPH